MKAQVFYSSYHIKYEDIPVPEITDDELLVRVKICGLCGTDIYKIQQEAVQPGTVLGHEVVGVIEKKGEKVKNFNVGKRVFVSHHTPCFSCKYCKHGNFSLCPLFKNTNIHPGGLAEFVRVPKDLVKNNVRILPDYLNDEEAVLIEPFACALRNINRIKPQPNDIVTIIGAGPSGLMHLILLKTMGIKKIRLVDVIDSRLQFAKKLGAAEMLNIRNEKIDRFKNSDVVIVNAGNKEAVQEALDIVRVGGKISIFAQVPEGIKIQLDPNLIYRETLILGTYSSTPVEQKEVFDMFVNGKLKDATSIISHRFPLKDFQKGLELAVEAKDSCKILFYP